MARDLKGIIVPIVTPFHADESLNERGLRIIVNYLVDRRVHGLFPCGSQGEFFALTMDERKRVMDVVIEENRGRAMVMPNVGAVTTRESVELARYAERAGADAVSLITPYFIKPGADELVRHFAQVIEAVSVPVLGYNNADRTGVELTPAIVTAILKAAPAFAGIKDSSGDLTNTLTYAEQTPARFKTFVGRDTLIFPALSCGCDGAVAATANVAPELVVGIYEAYIQGDLVLALERQRKLAPLRRAFTLGSFPVVVKEAMEIIGLPAGPARRPIAPLSDSARGKLETILKRMGKVD